jgi:predicted GTPase
MSRKRITIEHNAQKRGVIYRGVYPKIVIDILEKPVMKSMEVNENVGQTRKQKDC